jgi:uncharacterized membrane protein YgaE (UPF0421/DUF939 family)
MKVNNIYTFSFDKDFRTILAKIESELKEKIFKNEDELKNELNKFFKNLILIESNYDFLHSLKQLFINGKIEKKK